MGEVVHVEVGVGGAALAAQLLDVVQGLLGQPVAEPWAGREFVSHGLDVVHQALARRQAVDHAEVVGPLGAHPLAKHDELLGHAWGKLEAVGEVFDARDAHPIDRVLEEGVVSRDDEVADPGEHQTASYTAALHGGDGGLGNVAPAPAHADVDLVFARVEEFGARLVGVIRQEELAIPTFGHITAGRADVVTGGEVLASSGQDNGPDRIVVDGAAERGVERIGHLAVLRVAVLRPVHRQGRDRALNRIAHRLVRFVDDLGLLGFNEAVQIHGVHP